MGKHRLRGNTGNVWASPARAVYLVNSYQARHVDTDRQVGRRDVDAIPDTWFDPAIDRGPNDPDRGVR